MGSIIPKIELNKSNGSLFGNINLNKEKADLT